MRFRSKRVVKVTLDAELYEALAEIAAKRGDKTSHGDGVASVLRGAAIKYASQYGGYKISK